MRKVFLLSSCIALSTVLHFQMPLTVDQIRSLRRGGSPEISPDARFVAYTVRETDWDDNAYDTEIWIADVATGAAPQLEGRSIAIDPAASAPSGRTRSRGF